nr:MAG TPA: Protein of unknown function (DUF722) [Caudoviricetes sp.]
MTKKELSQLYYLKKEIKEQQRRLAELEAVAINCSTEITGLPTGKGISDKIGNYAAQIADLKALLDLNLKKCFYELNRIDRFIQSVEDSQIRIILTLRYIQGLSWQKIAYAIGEHDEQYPRRKHNTFLRNVGNDI